MIGCSQKILKGIKEAYVVVNVCVCVCVGGQTEEILFNTKNILATSEVINKQTKIKKNKIF